MGEAATQVAKAHGGAARLFKEFGIQVQQNTDGTKNYDGALAELAQKLQGQASASTDTFMGKLGALKAKVEDNVAAFGEKWGPSIMAASGLLAAAGPAASAMGTALEKLRAARLADAEAATGEAVAAGLANVALGVGFVAAGASAVYVLHELFSGQTQTAGATQDYTQAIQQQTGSLVANVDAVTSQKLASSDAARAANDAGVSYRTMADAVRNGTDNFGEYGRILNSNYSDTGLLIDQLTKAGAGTTDFGRSLLSLVESGKLSGDQLVNFAHLIEGLHNDYTNGKKSADAFASSQKDAADQTNNVTSAIKAQIDAMHAAMDPMFAMVKASEANRQAQDSVNAKTLEYIAAVRDHGAGSTQAAEAMYALNDAQMKSAQSAEDMNAAALDLAKGVLAGKITVDKARGTLESWVAQGIITQSTANSVATSFGGVVSQADGIIARSNIKVNVNADTSSAEDALSRLNSLISDTTLGFLNLNSFGARPFTGVSVGGGKAYALGGYVDAPKGTAVPATLHGGEFVLTAEQVESLKGTGMRLAATPAASSAGGGASVVINVDARGAQLGAGDQIINALAGVVRSGDVPLVIRKAFALP